MAEKQNMQSKKTRIIGLVVTILVVIAATAGLLWWNHDRNQTETQNTTTEQTTQAKIVEYKGEDGKNALEILQAYHQVETSSYEGVGEFVTKIDGRAADSTHFWAFYVDGVMAQVGAGEYQTKNGETITWKLDEIK